MLIDCGGRSQTTLDQNPNYFFRVEDSDQPPWTPVELGPADSLSANPLFLTVSARIDKPVNVSISVRFASSLVS